MSNPSQNIDGITSFWVTTENELVFTFTEYFGIPIPTASTEGFILRVVRSDGVQLSEDVRVYPDNGTISINAAPYLRDAAAQNDALYAEQVEADNTNLIGFYITDVNGNQLTGNYFAVISAMQAGEEYAPNLGNYTLLSDASTSPTVYNTAKFATEFDEPTYWRGYPWDMTIFNDSTEGTVNVDEYDAGGVIRLLNDYNYPATLVNRVLRVRLPELREDTDFVRVYIEPGIAVPDLVLTESSFFVLTEDANFIETE